MGIEADGVTLEGFEIVGDDETTSGVSIVILNAEIRLPGVGIAIQPLDGETSGTSDAATDVHRNDIEETSVDVIMGDVGSSRVFNNNR